jgi:hypothetical protein
MQPPEKFKLGPVEFTRRSPDDPTRKAFDDLDSALAELGRALRQTAPGRALSAWCIGSRDACPRGGVVTRGCYGAAMRHTTLEQYPTDVAEAIRDMLDIGVERELPAVTVINHMLRQLDEDEVRRVMEWAWDRYIEQPKRDALKPDVASPPADWTQEAA